MDVGSTLPGIGHDIVAMPFTDDPFRRTELVAAAGVAA